MKPRILVSNDDGVFSEGIAALAEALDDLAEVCVVAPDREQSASSHSLTLHRPLRVREIRDRWWTVDGTPTDCVMLAVAELLRDRRPDLVVSGINFGPNLGEDVTYSGTVSAGFEGLLLGIPSIALSQVVGKGFSFAESAAWARRLVAAVLAEPPGERMLLNVNFPPRVESGFRWTRLGNRMYEDSVVEKTDPRGRKYYWIAGTPRWELAEGTDHHAVKTGAISVTPLHLDLTDYETLHAPAGLAARLRELTREGDGEPS